jgi:EmrB/QacA subfamily drug resistance transporter
MSKKWWVLASVACGTFMATLDSSIVNIALPTLTKELGTTVFQVKWVVIIYLFTISCLLLPFGRLSDEYGRKKIFQAGYLVFIFGSALCGISGSLPLLVFFRTIQAIGGAMLMVNGPAIITSTFSPYERGAALGTLAMVVSAGLISGPSIGGLLITYFTWKSIFWVNIPIGLAGTYLVHLFVKQDSTSKSQSPFDWPGAIIQVFFLLGVILIFDPPHVSLSGGRPMAFESWIIAIFTLALGFAFIRIEATAETPLFDLSLLKNKVFLTANIASFFTFVSFSSVSVLMPFFLEEVMGLPPDKTGMFMTAIPLTIFVIAPISGRLSDRFGGQELSFSGGAIAAIGLLAMAGAFGSGIQKDVAPSSIILALCSIGLSLGLFQSPNNSAIMSSVPLEKLGVASAFLATVRNLGLVVGTGLSTGLFSARLRATGDYIASIHSVHLLAAVISAGAMIASLAKGRGTVSQPQNPEGSNEPHRK